MSDDDNDECGNDFSGEHGEECDFSHEQACSITKSIVLSRMCGAPVVTTQTDTKGAASTKRWVVATFLGGDWCFGDLPVRVVSEEHVSIDLSSFKHLLKVLLKPLGWS